MSIDEQQKLKDMADLIKRYDAQREALRTMERQISEACRDYEKVSRHRGLSIDSMRRTLVYNGLLSV
jgi:hypothetical protein